MDIMTILENVKLALKDANIIKPSCGPLTLIVEGTPIIADRDETEGASVGIVANEDNQDDCIGVAIAIDPDQQAVFMNVFDRAVKHGKKVRITYEIVKE